MQQPLNPSTKPSLSSRRPERSQTALALGVSGAAPLRAHPKRQSVPRSQVKAARCVTLTAGSLQPFIVQLRDEFRPRTGETNRKQTTPFPCGSGEEGKNFILHFRHCNFFTFGTPQDTCCKEDAFRERSKSSRQQTSEMGGSDPTFSASSRPKSFWSRSRPYCFDLRCVSQIIEGQVNTLPGVPFTQAFTSPFTPHLRVSRSSRRVSLISVRGLHTWQNHRSGLERPHFATETVAVAPAQFIFGMRRQRDRASTSLSATISQGSLVRVTRALMTRDTHTVTRHATSPLWKVAGNSPVASRVVKTLDARQIPDWAGATPLSLPSNAWRSLKPSDQ
jgi:hypothetical protein